MYKINIAFFY